MRLSSCASLQHQHAQRSSSHRAVNNSDVSRSVPFSSDRLRPLQTLSAAEADCFSSAVLVEEKFELSGLDVGL